MQRGKLGAVTWHESVGTLPEMPTIFIANEFFDALPIQQFEMRDEKCFERCVGVENGALKIGLVPSPARKGGDGIHEVSTVSKEIATKLASHIQSHGGAALVIDYGHLKSAAGDTLQAMCEHKYCDILEKPGQADITAHVDFERLGSGVAMTQGQFLKAMGIELRTEKLAAKLEGQAKADFLAASRRLVDADQMGDLFKVMCVVQKGTAPLYPFEVS
jgi:NADH dehydrogenase [ubiquinone] 1 alpha subcomplex assembly factor 7